MKYAKPELVVSGSSLATIQGLSGTKNIHSFTDNVVGPDYGKTNAFSSAAYEADE